MKYKVLMCNGQFVNAAELDQHNDVQVSDVPSLFAHSVTIWDMVEAASWFGPAIKMQNPALFIRNLKLCELVEYTLEPVIQIDLFRDLQEEEKMEFEQWARDNYVLGEAINPFWHPVVQSTCRHLNDIHFNQI